jgi:hypothetical protein
MYDNFVKKQCFHGILWKSQISVWWPLRDTRAIFTGIPVWQARCIVKYKIK